MAKAEHFNAPYFGKLGNTVSYRLGDIYVRRTIGKYKGNPSQKQLANFMEMKVSMAFLRHITGYVNAGFELEARGTKLNPFNIATSYVKKGALKGDYPNLSVDYSKAILSKGTVPVAAETSITKTEGGVLIKWSTDAAPLPYRRDDSTMVLLYLPGEGFAYTSLNACKRADGAYFFPLRKNHMDKPLEAWITFKQDDGKAVSDSMYVGNLNGEIETAQDLQHNKQYTEAKKRFDIVEAQYLKRFNELDENKPEDKSFRSLRKEYEVLKEKLKYMPGKLIN